MIIEFWKATVILAAVASFTSAEVLAQTVERDGGIIIVTQLKTLRVSHKRGEPFFNNGCRIIQTSQIFPQNYVGGAASIMTVKVKKTSDVVPAYQVTFRKVDAGQADKCDDTGNFGPSISSSGLAEYNYNQPFDAAAPSRFQWTTFSPGDKIVVIWRQAELDGGSIELKIQTKVVCIIPQCVLEGGKP